MSKRTFCAVLASILLSTACGGESSDAAKSGSGGASAEAGSAKIGDACASAAECPAGGSGTPVCVTDWPEGYCAVSACAEHGHDCPDDPGLGGTAKTGGKCVLAPTETCLALCASDADCRDGYECVGKPDAAGHTSTNVCFPKSSTAGTMSGGGGMSSGGMGNGGGMMDGGM